MFPVEWAHFYKLCRVLILHRLGSPLPPTNYARPTKQPPWCRETSSRPSFRVLEREGSARSLLRPAWSTFLVNWITIRDVISDILYLSWDEAWRQNISIHINEKGKKMYKSVLNVCAFFFGFHENSLVETKSVWHEYNSFVLGRNIRLFHAK